MRPGEGKQPFRLHFLHDRLPFEMLVAGICNLATRDLTLDKWAIQFHTKPFAKFTVIRHSTPDPCNRCLEFNPLHDTVIHYTQPPGCILPQTDAKSNLLVARFYVSELRSAVTCGRCRVSKPETGSDCFRFADAIRARRCSLSFTPARFGWRRQLFHRRADVGACPTIG